MRKEEKKGLSWMTFANAAIKASYAENGVGDPFNKARRLRQFLAFREARNRRFNEQYGYENCEEKFSMENAPYDDERLYSQDVKELVAHGVPCTHTRVAPGNNGYFRYMPTLNESFGWSGEKDVVAVSEAASLELQRATMKGNKVVRDFVLGRYEYVSGEGWIKKGK